MGGGEGVCDIEAPLPPPIFSPLTPVRGTVIPRDAIAASGTSNFPFDPRARHRHSARRDSGERNLQLPL